MENYKDLADEGFLGLGIPEEFGGMGFSMFEYAMVGPRLPNSAGATALTFNMHNSSMAWSRFMYDMPNPGRPRKRQCLHAARTPVPPCNC